MKLMLIFCKTAFRNSDEIDLRFGWSYDVANDAWNALAASVHPHNRKRGTYSILKNISLVSKYE